MLDSDDADADDDDEEEGAAGEPEPADADATKEPLAIPDVGSLPFVVTSFFVRGRRPGRRPLALAIRLRAPTADQ